MRLLKVETFIATYDVFGPELKLEATVAKWLTAPYIAQTRQRLGQVHKPHVRDRVVASSAINLIAMANAIHRDPVGSGLLLIVREYRPYIAANRYYLHLSCCTEGCCLCPLVAGRVPQ